MKSKIWVWFEVSYRWAGWLPARHKIGGLAMCLLVMFVSLFVPGKARAQSVEVEQLLINVKN